MSELILFRRKFIFIAPFNLNNLLSIALYNLLNILHSHYLAIVMVDK